MSVDFERFMEGLRDQCTHLSEVFSGISQEETQDHSFMVMALLPVLLNSKVSPLMRSQALREYTQMQGSIRDLSFGYLTREDFFRQASEDVVKESIRYDDLRAASAKRFQYLKDSLDDAGSTEISAMEEEYELFKSQLSLVIKSALGIPEDQPVGPKEVLEYLSIQRSRSV